MADAPEIEPLKDRWRQFLEEAKASPKEYAARVKFTKVVSAHYGALRIGLIPKRYIAEAEAKLNAEWAIARDRMESRTAK